MVWVGRLEKLLKVIGRLQCLALQVMPGCNCDPLGRCFRPFLLPLVLLLARLLATSGGAPRLSSGDHLPVALDEDGPNCLFTRGMPGCNVK
jgi:hypothetical protein